MAIAMVEVTLEVSWRVRRLAEAGVPRVPPLPSAQQEWGAARAMSDDRFFRRFPTMLANVLTDMEAKLRTLEGESTTADASAAAVRALVMHLALLGRLAPRPDGTWQQVG